MSEPLQVFVSYASTDRERALEIADALGVAGVRVWIDRRGIAGGTVWIEEIARAVRESPVLLVLCSRESVISRNVRQELQLAWDQDKPILPLLLEPVEFPDAVAYILHGRQWIDTHNRSAAEWISDVHRALTAVHSTRPVELPVVVSSARAINGTMPAPPTPLVGREIELAAIRVLVNSDRLVTLTGSGGTGKTRLAIAVATGLTARFTDGIVFVDLAAIADPSAVMAGIALALGVRENAARALLQSVALFSAGKRLLLVLDNFEHVLAAAPEIATLLETAPDLHLLVTSRAILRLRAEREYVLSPLASNPAVTLFAARASAVRPSFELTEENATAVGEICRRLDGLPLAIELAAARIKFLTPQSLLDRLQQRLPTLVGGARDLPARQQTIRDAIAWSYDLLSPTEQHVCRRLAMFAGGWTIESGEAVAALPAGVDFFEHLTSLIEKSLVQMKEEPGGDLRFSMLETIREFGHEQLERYGERESTALRHLAFFLAFAQEGEQGREFYDAEYSRRRMSRFEAEDGNIRFALETAILDRESERGIELVADLWSFWRMRARLREGRDWVYRALEAGPVRESAARAYALQGAAAIAAYLQDGERAVRFLEEAIALARSLELWNRVPELLLLQGEAAMVSGDYDLARNYFTESLSFARSHHLEPIETTILGSLGFVAGFQRDFEAAVDYLDASIQLSRQIGTSWMEGSSLRGLAEVARRRDDSATAARQYAKALRAHTEHGDQLDISSCLTGLAALADATGHVRAAARLGAAAWSLNERFGEGDFSILPPERVVVELLERPELAAAVKAGKRLSIAEAISEACELAELLSATASD